MSASICKRDKTTGKKIHSMSLKEDGAGRKFESCDKCGACFSLYIMK